MAAVALTVWLFMLLLGVGGALLLYHLVRAEREQDAETVTDFASAERTARRDTDERTARRDTDERTARRDTDERTARRDTDERTARRDTDDQSW
jgi:hypothetical protein